MVKIAVVTRTKDRSVFLKRAIKSVSEQSYQEFHHIIVNDGGDKAEVEGIIKGFSDSVQAKIKLFHRDESSNAPDTIFNESIDRVDSEYFAIHDDDDTWHSDFLSVTVGYLDNHEEAGAVVVRTDKVLEKINDSTVELKKQFTYLPEMKAVGLYQQCIDNQLTPIATLFRRSAYQEVGKFDNSLPVIGDWEFGIRLLQKYPVGYIDREQALAYYHHRSDGINSFTQHNHRKYITQIADRYLRQELAEGRLGVGYIMSQLKYNQDVRHGLLKKIIPKAIIRRYRNRNET